ncbi:MAG: AMP-binding protein [Thermodesulfobacteriota bacterium]
MALHDFTFYDLISRNAVTFADKTAWVEADDRRSLTFFEYKHHIERLAKGLQELGISKGDRIGILGKNSLEYFLLYGSAAAIGAICLPINWRLSGPEVAFNLNDGAPKIIFADDEYQDLIEKENHSLPSVQNRYNLKNNLGRFSSFESLMVNKGDFNPADVSTHDGFVIIHTAAVTGKPRGALLSHGNVLSANIHLNHAFGLSQDDVHLNLLPLFHVGGLFMATNSFHVGAVNVNMSKFDPEKAVSLIQENGVTLFFDFPPILSSIIDASERTGKSIRSVRAVLGLGVPDTIKKYQNMTGGTFFSMYGQTETSCLATLSPYNHRPGSAGRMILLSDVRLVDEDDRPVRTGEVGEITIKGPMVFLRYWNLPEDTDYAFRNGWHHTGDLGRFDKDGFLWYAGRKAEKELIKPGGEIVYPAEVEKAILQHPFVEKTVVFGVPDPKWKEGIKAVCQLKEGKQISSRELIAFVGERIASFKKPQHVQFVSEMPLKGDGSIDRGKVKALYGKP